MSLLPIVERELRVAARRKSTHRMRTLLALAVVVLWFLLLVTGNNSNAEKGPILFIAIGVLALGFGLLAGIFLTADSLSEEKREGTLGLLFLTDLEGYDVVLGKLIATSLHAIYGLLAVLPVLALPLLMGGVTAGEFWRVTVVLVATLLFSLSLGMAVSAVSRETRQAMAGTLLVLLVLAGILPVLWWLQRWTLAGAPWDLLLWPSPGFLYSRAFESCFAYRGGAAEFWKSLGAIAALSLFALAAAALYLPRSWHIAGENASGGVESHRWTRSRRFRSPDSRWFGHYWLEQNPFFWLASRDKLPRRLVLGVLAILLLIWTCFLFGLNSSSGRTLQICLSVTMLMAFGIHQILKVFIAVEASRRLSEDKRSGALELMLVSPLSVGRIVSGQRGALRNIFGWAMALTLLTNAALFCMLVFGDAFKADNSAKAVFSEMLIGGGLMLAVDYLALTRVGMCMALRTRRHDRAIVGTFLRVMLLPWLGILFFFFMSISNHGMTEETVALLMALWFFGCAIFDLVLAGRASVEVERQMRTLCAGLESPTGGWEYPAPDSITSSNRRKEALIATRITPHPSQ